MPVLLGPGLELLGFVTLSVVVRFLLCFLIAKTCPKMTGNEAKRNDNSARTDTRDTPTSNHGDVELKGRNTFAVPRNVKPLGWSSRNKPQSDAVNKQEDENPKSNDEFRKMFMKT